MDTNTLIVILIVVIVFAVAIYISFASTSKESSISRDIKSKISRINANPQSTNIHELKSALIEYDKLFDYYLRKMKFPGSTMGERLKSAKNAFDRDTYNKIWIAHKLRNTLVHEVESEFQPQLIRNEIYNLKKALESKVTN